MIQVCDDFEGLSRVAAGLIADQARRAVTARGQFCRALSGGSTPRRCYELLAQSPWREQLPWEQVHIFWGDERCVPVGAPRSNAGMATEALLKRVPLPPSQIHPMVCAADPGAPRFDLILPGEVRWLVDREAAGQEKSRRP